MALSVSVSPLALPLLTMSRCRFPLTGSSVLTIRPLARSGWCMKLWVRTGGVGVLISWALVVVGGGFLLSGVLSGLMMCFSSVLLMLTSSWCLARAVVMLVLSVGFRCSRT